MNIPSHPAWTDPCALRGKAFLVQLLGLLVAVLAVGCGGGDDGAAASGAASKTIGPAGGTLDGAGGARIVVPAGALAVPTTIAIEATDAGAPALPQGFTAGGQMYAFTPHGTTFAVPVTIVLPIDRSRVPAGQGGSFYKTDAAGNWQRIDAATVQGDFVSAEVTSFSSGLFGFAPPFIPASQQPQDATVAVGATATFSVNALGAPPFTYQWEISTDGGANWNAIGGATARVHTTPAATLAQHGTRLRVVVSNPDGATTSQAAVLGVSAVAVAPAIVTGPVAASVAVGGSATFSVTVTGSTPLYQWQRSNDGGVTFTDIVGATNASYTLGNAQVGDSGAQFKVIVSNGAGVAPSGAVVLTVTAAPPQQLPVALGRIAAHDGFSLALNAAGVPYSWGSDSAATLGNGIATGNRSDAAPLGTLDNVRSLAAGDLHGVAVRVDGTAWAWGYSGSVVCGAGSVFEAPVQVAGAADVAAASTGNGHTLLLTRTGTVLSFGCNGSGQLGRAASQPSDLARAAAVVGLPAAPTTIVAVAAGRDFSLALDSAGNVWSWGGGALGDGSNPPSGRIAPMLVPQLAGVVAIAAGADHALALKGDGSVWAWGGNGSGKLGDGTTTERATPTASLLTARIVAIAAGSDASLALRDDGTVLSWGSNAYGGLGAGPGAPFTRPQPAPVLGLGGVAEIAMGSGLQHGLARRTDGSVWAWGDNSRGQLGDGTTTARPTPVQVVGLNLN